MHDTGFVDLEINLTLLHLLDGLCNIHGYGTALGVRHKSAGAEDAAQGTELAHHRGLRDDHVDICPAFLDLLQIFIKADIVSTCFLGSSFGIGVAEHKHAHLLTGTVRKRNHAAYHLIGLARINSETDIDIKRCVELLERSLLHLFSSLIECISLPGINLR